MSFHSFLHMIVNVRFLDNNMNRSEESTQNTLIDISRGTSENLYASVSEADVSFCELNVGQDIK